MNLFFLFMRMKNSMYQCLIIKVVVVEDQWQVSHLKIHIFHLVTLSTLSEIVFNALKSIIRKKY